MIKTTINKKDIFAFLLCLSFIQVDAILFTISRIGYIAMMMAASFIVILLTIKDRTITKSYQFIIWMVLLAWMIICTFMNSQNLIYPIYYVGQVGIWFLINDWFFEKGSLRLLRAMRKYMSVVIVITFLQQFIVPGVFGYTDAMNARNILASDNFLGYNYIAFIAICFILDFVDYEKIRPKTYFMVGICYISIIRAWSVKSMIGIGFIVLYILFVYRKKISRLFEPRVLLILFVAIFIGTVFLNIQDRFLDIFTTYFGKRSSVSVRYYVWTQAIVNIKAHPVWGYGIREGQRLMLQSTWAGHARSSHNIVLEVILEGGFIGFGIYFISIVSAIAGKKEKFKGKNRYEYLFLIFVVFAFFVMELASGSVYYPFYYMPIILINNLDKIVDIKEKQNCYGQKKNMYCYQLQPDN